MKTTAAPGDRLQLGLLILLIVGVPTVFIRNTFTTFDVPQLTILWLVALGVLMVSVYQVVSGAGLERLPRPVWMSLAFFAAAILLTTILSVQPWVSFTGLTVRGAGALTYGLCLALMHSAFSLGRRGASTPLIGALVATSAVVTVYALLQAFGWDPFSWGQGVLFVQPVFSTLGNPNFSAGYLATTLPLVAYAAFGSSLRLGLKSSAAGLLAAASVALAHLGSLQGIVASLMAVTVIGHWALTRMARRRLATLVVAAVPSLTVAVVPSLSSPPGLGLFACLAVANVAAASAATFIPSLVVDRADSRLSRQALPATTRLRVFGACAAAVLATIAFRGPIAAAFESGLEQRFALWRTSLSIFGSSPLVGTGLETYPAQFTTHRPRSHALEWENVLSDSPHSVPLGFLSGGGLLLAVAYLTVFATVALLGVRAVRRAQVSDQGLFWSVLAAWSGYHLQSAVSMDTPGLIHVPWVLAGVLVAGAVATGPEEADKEVSKAPARRTRSGALPNIRGGVAALACLVVYLACLAPIVSPVRADLAAHRAQQALLRGDLQTGGDELLEAIDLQPRNGFYREGMAIVYEESGLLELAYEQRARSASLGLGNPGSALQAARLAMRAQRPADAESWVNRALEWGPNMASVLADSASLLARSGKDDRARDLLEEFEALESSNVGAWESAGHAYRSLGEEELAARASLCASWEQVGCWPERPVPEICEAGTPFQHYCRPEESESGGHDR